VLNFRFPGLWSLTNLPEVRNLDRPLVHPPATIRKRNKMGAVSQMHFAITTTWGPTDTTRASLPFRFAASALAAGDTALIMLFGDSIMLAEEETYAKMVLVGQTDRFSEVFTHPNAEVVVSKCCAEARGITPDMLVQNCRFGGMNDFHAHVALEDTKAIGF
jgi:sulfur relay (sulfurtransferase) complex TusBCD TusD component (DsrE family)